MSTAKINLMVQQQDLKRKLACDVGGGGIKSNNI